MQKVMNEQQARRIHKLMKINMKCEYPPDLILKFVNDSIFLDNKIHQMSDKEVIDVLIMKEPKEEHDQISIGVMFHILTSGEQQDIFNRFVRYINGGGVEYWYTILCNMNMALFELFPFIHWTCKEQLLKLVREGVRQNVKQIENVVTSAFRTTISSNDFQTKLRVLTYLASMLREFEPWFRGQKSCSALVAMILSSVSHAIVSSPAPMTREDQFRDNMASFAQWVIRTRRLDCATLGRDFILVLIRIGKLPQIEEVWRELVASPAAFGVSSLEDYLIKPNQLQQLRLSFELFRRIEFMVYYGGKNLLTYFHWLTNKFFRGPDGNGMRAECVRFLVGWHMDPQKAQPGAAENRIQLIHLLMVTTPPGADQQWLKLCLFADWLGCDERIPQNFALLDVPLGVVRHALFLVAPPPHANSPIQGSHCSQFANSLFEYVCKSVEVFLPAYSDLIRKNVNNAMRYCKERFGHGFSQILEHHKIDRRVGELMRTVWPEFFRSTGGLGTAMPPKFKKRSVERPPPPLLSSPASAGSSQPSATSSQSADSDDSLISPVAHLEKIDKKLLRDAEKIVEKIDKEKAKREKEEREANDLETSMALLKGETRTKLEALRAQWRDFNDDADKCEAVENLLTSLVGSDEPLEDAQQEIAAQCLLAIMGSVVVGSSGGDDEKSLLPANERDLSEAFTHPIYSFLKMLCSPPGSSPDSDDVGTELILNLMAAMREKDPSLTYVLLYFIKGTGARPKDCIETYKEVARISEKEPEEMLAEDLELMGCHDIRLFNYLVPFVLVHFDEEVQSAPVVFEKLCAQIDGAQLRALISDLIRDEIKLFRKDTFTKFVMASVEWPTTSQWVFWHLVHADGVPIEWFLSAIPKIDGRTNDEAAANILLMMKRMDREPWAGLIRAIFSRAPTKDECFTADALKVLIEDQEQSQKVAELVGQLVKKLLANNDIVGINVKQASKKGSPLKLTLQQVLEHMQQFSTTCVQKKSRITEKFLARSQMQDAFAAIKANDKANVIVKKYSNLFGAMDIIAQDSKETSSRTLRGNRGGSSASPSSSSSAGDKQQQQQQQKRKTASDTAADDDQGGGNKKRKTHKEVIQIDSESESSSDSD